MEHGYEYEYEYDDISHKSKELTRSRRTGAPDLTTRPAYIPAEPAPILAIPAIGLPPHQLQIFRQIRRLPIKRRSRPLHRDRDACNTPARRRHIRRRQLGTRCHDRVVPPAQTIQQHERIRIRRAVVHQSRRAVEESISPRESSGERGTIQAEVQDPIRETGIGVVDQKGLRFVVNVVHSEFARQRKIQNRPVLAVAVEVKTRVPATCGLPIHEPEWEPDFQVDGGIAGRRLAWIGRLS